MIRSRLVLAWYARFRRRDEDQTLHRFDSLRNAPATTRVSVFYTRKAA
jgi:hypothetical protein